MAPRAVLYLDAAATTPLAPEVAAAMAPLLAGPPAGAGGAAEVAAALGVAPEALRLTTGGTAANHLALRGAVAAFGVRRLISQPTEHPSVREALRALEAEGLPVTWLPVDGDGRVRPDELRGALAAGERPALVSLMHANNETGVLQPVADAAALAREAGARLHVDAVQSARHLDVRPAALGADLVVLTAHKLDGPKGAAAVVAAPGARAALAAGGAAPAPGPAALAGFAAALARRARLRAEGEASRVAASRDALQAALAGIPGLRVTGAAAPRLPGHLHVTLPDVSGDALVLLLDEEGIACSTGAACAAGDPSPSRVLLALGRSPAEARGSLRLSLPGPLDAAEVARVAGQLAAAVRRLRALA